MKKKLEAELISIAHRILKLKNRAELEQLQQETLKLYEKLSVLKFIEDHYGGAEPTIGRASALGTLEEVYGIEEVAPVHANEVEEKEEAARAKKAEQAKAAKEVQHEKPEEPAQDKENESGEGVDTDGDGKAPVAEAEKAQAAPEEEEEAEETVAEVKEAEPEAEAEAETAVEEEKEEEAPVADGEEAEVAEEEVAEEAPKAEIEKPELPKTEQPEHQEPQEEPEVKVQVEKPEEDIKAEEASAKAVFEKEIDATTEEEEKAADAELKTITPNPETKVEPSQTGFEFAYERKPAPDGPVKREISFEDFKDYKEPEFVKKGATAQAPDPKGEQTPAAEADDVKPKAEEPKQSEPVRDWRDWEPSTSPYGQKKEEPKPAAPKPLNTGLGSAIMLGLNDRIAFEKNLFGGSADDLNRVISQLNTLNSFEEAQNFINDLVKPDYNNWANKEEYEERFMAIVEKRFS